MKDFSMSCCHSKYHDIVITMVCFVMSTMQCHAQQRISIWQDVSSYHGEDVSLTAFLPPKKQSPSAAIIICPGGSYFWLSKKTEGTDVARWLQSNGIAAFVLNYRVAGIGSFITHYRLFMRGTRFPDMIQDLQRSIQIVRENANKYSIATDKIGVMGFSAGGHLALTAAEYASVNYLASLNIHPLVSLSPDFIAAIYPVVTMRDARYVHRRSRRALLGEWGKNNKTMRDSLSMERHLHAGCPPVFIMNCKDDPTVKYQNSLLLDSALTASHIRHRYIQYNNGGHGFGADPEKNSKESIGWKEKFIIWLKSIVK
jgi:acetyl esterase/lipase